MSEWPGRALGTVLLVGAVAALTSCGAGASGGEEPAATSGAPEDGHAHHAGAAAGEPSAHSIYNLDSRWTDQHGRALRLTSLAGRTQAVAMVYTSCAFACPRILADLKRIEAELGAAYRDDVGFVLVSIDPERDTPERLRAFAAGARLDPDHWTLLHGDDLAVRELATVLGVKYRRTSATDFQHSNVITVLDPAGEIVHRQVGLGVDPADALAAMEAAVGGVAPPVAGV